MVVLVLKFLAGGDVTVTEKSFSELVNIQNFLSESIMSVVDYSDASVRLRNVLIDAGPGDTFSTVREYLAAGADAFARYLSLPNCGRKSALELNEIIHNRFKAVFIQECERLPISHILIKDLPNLTFASDDVKAFVAKEFGNTRIATYLHSNFKKDHIPNVAGQLDRLIWDAIIRSALDLPEGKTRSEYNKNNLTPSNQPNQPNQLDQIPFFKSLYDHNMSSRLWRVLHALERQRAHPKSVADFIKRQELFSAKLRAIGHVGSKTIKELDDIIRAIVQNPNYKCEVSSDVAITDRSRMASSKEFVVEQKKDHNSTIPSHLISSDVIDAVKRHGKPEVLNFLRGRLDAREFDVLCRRYGILQPSSETLGNIAVSYGVTCERIRQIEVKAMRKCSARSALPIFEAYLMKEEPTIISIVVGPDRCILSGDALTQKSALDPLHCLSIDICFGSYEEWLRTHLKAIRDEYDDVIGWVVHGQRDESDLERSFSVQYRPLQASGSASPPHWRFANGPFR